jgi:hypothetical protein
MGNERALDRDNLIDFVKTILANFSKGDDSLDLLALSLPIALDHNGWSDLTIVKAATDSALMTDIDIEERSSCFCVGSLLVKKLSYEFSEKTESQTTCLQLTHIYS